jgi:hypothetical protein
VDIHFFFANGVETAASAFLATLLEQEAGFRVALLRRIQPDLEINEADAVTVAVEHPLGDGRVDVYLVSPMALVLIENKTQAGSKTDNQLCRYYEACNPSQEQRRVVAVYLAPKKATAESEVAKTREGIQRAGRTGRDVAKALTWEDVNSVILETPLSDQSFALDGIRTVLHEIKKAESRIFQDWDLRMFLAAADAGSPEGKYIVHQIDDWIRRAERMLERAVCPPEFGHGGHGNMYVTFRTTHSDQHRIVRVAQSGPVEIYYAEIKKAKPFDDPPKLLELMARLRRIPGAKTMNLGDSAAQGNSSFIMPSVLMNPLAMDVFLRVLAWLARELAVADDAQYGREESSTHNHDEPGAEVV